MRILHVHSGNLYGGIETVLTTLARRSYACPELQQEFVLCFEGRLSDELASLGSKPHDLGPVRVSRPLSVIRTRRKLRKLLTDRKFEALVFHSAWSHAIFAPIARARRLLTVVWMHGTTGGRHWSERWSQRMRPNVVLCNSKFTASKAWALYPGTSKRVLYCPLELDSANDFASTRSSVRQELNTAEHAVVVIQVGRIAPGKGQLLHLEALARLKALSNWVCWFAGGPQEHREERYFDEMRFAATRLGIADRVRFLNERSDVPRLLKAADIYCQPNIEPESFGLTLVEALNAGIPVLTTSIGGANEILDHKCGVLVPPHDTQALSATLDRMIQDCRLRQQLGQHGRIRARELCEPLARIREFHGILANLCSSITNKT